MPFGIRKLSVRDLAPEYLKTPILLAGALGVYAAGEAVQPEIGLVGATLFGVVLANIDVTGSQELRRFKESLTVFLTVALAGAAQAEYASSECIMDLQTASGRNRHARSLSR